MEKQAVLEVINFSTGYGPLQIIWDCSLTVNEKETLLLLGSNGSGKTTLLKGIVGYLPANGGSVRFMGRDVTRVAIHAKSRMGITYCSESSIYPMMTVRENLLMSCINNRDSFNEGADHVFEVFPDLKKFERSRASGLSGGQRKMLVIGRVLMAKPRLLLLDEPSSGLSPLFTEKIIESLLVLKDMGTPMLISEQNTEFTRIAEKVMVLDHGRVVFSGSEGEAERNEAIHSAYFGIG